MESNILLLVTELASLVAFVSPLFVKVKKISNGTKCQLRSEMLHIYYKHKDKKTIRQYEYENFVFLYESYKELKGNSFIDKIYTEIKEIGVYKYLRYHKSTSSYNTKILLYRKVLDIPIVLQPNQLATVTFQISLPRITLA